MQAHSSLLFLFFLPWCHFFCSTAPQAFFRPNHVFERLARAGAVKIGRRSDRATNSSASRPHLDGREHDGKLIGLGGEAPPSVWVLPSWDLSFAAGYIVLFAVDDNRRIMDLRKLRRRNVPNGITEVSREESRGRRGPSRQGRRFAKMAKG